MKKIISVLLILLLFQSTNLNVKAQEERIIGDLHQDNIIDIKDLVLLKAKILNKYTLENENFIFADIDENKITYEDRDILENIEKEIIYPWD